MYNINTVVCSVPVTPKCLPVTPFLRRYEKMISGMYMGEIARQVLVELVDAGLLFPDQPCDALREKSMFFTKYISEIERSVIPAKHVPPVVCSELSCTDTTSHSLTVRNSVRCTVYTGCPKIKDGIF